MTFAGLPRSNPPRPCGPNAWSLLGDTSASDPSKDRPVANLAPVPLRRRMLAGALDFGFPFAGFLVTFLIASDFWSLLQTEHFSQRSGLLWIAAVGTASAVLLAKFARAECGFGKGSWGKRLVGICVVDRNGTQVGSGRSIWRLVAKCLVFAMVWCLATFPFLVAGVILPTVNSILPVLSGLLAWMGCYVTYRNRTAHDWISGTLVVDCQAERETP